MLTVKFDYTRLSDGYHGSIITQYPGNLINALAYFQPDTVFEIGGGEVRVDFVYVWPGGLEEHEALKVWRGSREGIAYSMKGIRGPYTPAAEGW